MHLLMQKAARLDAAERSRALGAQGSGPCTTLDSQCTSHLQDLGQSACSFHGDRGVVSGMKYNNVCLVLNVEPVPW